MEKVKHVCVNKMVHTKRGDGRGESFECVYVGKNVDEGFQ